MGRGVKVASEQLEGRKSSSGEGAGGKRGNRLWHPGRAGFPVQGAEVAGQVLPLESPLLHLAASSPCRSLARGRRVGHGVRPPPRALPHPVLARARRIARRDARRSPAFRAPARPPVTR